MKPKWMKHFQFPISELEDLKKSHNALEESHKNLTDHVNNNLSTKLELSQKERELRRLFNPAQKFEIKFFEHFPIATNDIFDKINAYFPPPSAQDESLQQRKKAPPRDQAYTLARLLVDYYYARTKEIQRPEETPSAD